jgi:5-carboxymethyl-2-hydroxymuconate isomerase
MVCDRAEKVTQGLNTKVYNTYSGDLRSASSAASETAAERRRGKMPHFIIDCSETILQQKSPDEIMQAVYEVAEETGLFAANDIKVRLRPYQYFKLGAGQKDFIHIFGNIMEGRSTEQKANLSHTIIERLNEMFPDLAILSMNIREFEQATYSNKALIHPLNTTRDRHFDIPKQTKGAAG